MRPFLIDWGDTAHPVDTLPVVPVSFEIRHSDPNTLRAELAALGVTPGVRRGNERG